MANSTEDHKISLDNQLEKLQQILKENPKDPSALMALGEVALRRGKKLMALQVFQKLSEIKPDAIEVHASLAKIYGTQKMYDEAYYELAHAMELDKGNIESRVLYNILIAESAPPEKLVSFFKTNLLTPFKSDNLTLYLQQLEIEKEKLQNDVEEFASLLESSPMNTILEYSKSMADQRLKIVEELLKSAKELEQIKFEPQPETPEENTESKSSSTAFKQPNEGNPPEEKVIGKPLSPDKIKVMQEIQNLLEQKMQILKNSKAVKGIVILHISEGVTALLSDAKEEITSAAPILRENLSSLLTYSNSLKSWVIAFQQGLIIFQALVPKFFIGIYADSPSVLGTLLFSMDKSVPSFIEALKNLDVTQLDE